MAVLPGVNMATGQPAKLHHHHFMTGETTMLNNSERLRVLAPTEIDNVSGGFVCGGFCVLGAIVAGAALYKTGVAIGKAWGEATR